MKRRVLRPWKVLSRVSSFPFRNRRHVNVDVVPDVRRGKKRNNLALRSDFFKEQLSIRDHCVTF